MKIGMFMQVGRKLLCLHAKMLKVVEHPKVDITNSCILLQRYVNNF